MKLNNSKNASRNIIVGMASRILMMLLQFLFRTAFIYRLGAEYLGLNSIFGAILNVLNLAELGICSSITFCMYKPIADDDIDKICALENFYKKCYQIIGLVVLVVGLICIPFLKVFIHADIPADVNIYTLYALVLGNTVASYYFFSYKNSLFNAYQRQDIKLKVGIVLTVAQYLTQIILIYVIPNYYLYLITNIVFTACTSIVTAFVADKAFPQIRPRGNIDSETKSIIINKVKGMLIYKLSGVMNGSFDTFVLSAFIGLALLGKLNNYQYISSSVATILAICTGSLTAGIGNSLVVKSRNDNFKDYMALNFVFMWIAGWTAICILCLTQTFIVIWAGEQYLLNTIIVIEISMLFYVNQCFSITNVYRDASGIWDLDKSRPVIAALTNLVSNILIVRYLGIIGVLLSSIIVGLLFNMYMGTIVLLKKEFPMGIKLYYKQLLYTSFIIMIAAAITYYVTIKLEISGLSGLIVKGIICVILPNFLIWLGVFKSKYYRDGIDFICRIIRNISPKIYGILKKAH